MENTSRMQKSIKNVAYSMLGYVCTILLQFINRLMFVHFLPLEYLGIHGLFTNLISMMALSELGIGSAMVFALYKPVASKDQERIKSLMALYKKLYTTIGLFIMILGCILTPFLSFFIKDMPNIPYLKFYFLLYVLDAGMSYFYTYKRSLIICHQDEYISTLTTMIASSATRILQIVFLFFTHNFTVYLIIQIVLNRLENVLIGNIANQKYPFLKEKNIQPLEKEELRSIQKNVAAMVFHKIGDVVVNATDNVIVSKILGIVSVGFLSNYTMIFDMITGIVLKVFASITPSLGNLVAIESTERSEEVLHRVLFANFWIVSFCTISLYTLSQPFLTLWLGKEYILSGSIVLVLSGVFYVSGMRRTVLQYRSAAGLFWQDRYKPLVEAIVNLAISIPLTIKLGILGVKLGTLISLLTTAFWFEAYILYKHYFHKSCIPYLCRQGFYAGITIGTGIAVQLVCRIFSMNLVGFLAKGIVCVLLINGIYLLLFYKTQEGKYFIRLFLTRFKLISMFTKE